MQTLTYNAQPKCEGNTMKAIVLDTETTGLFEPQVVELASLPVSNSFKVSDSSIEVDLFEPNKEIERAAQEVHGINPSDLKGKPNCKELLSVSSHLDKAEYVIGHNITYDIDAINNSIEMAREFKTICTKRLAYELLDPQSSYSLVGLVNKHLPEVARRYAPKAHSAKADVMMTVALLEFLAVKLAEKLGLGHAINLDDLYQYSKTLHPMEYADYKIAC